MSYFNSKYYKKGDSVKLRLSMNSPVMRGVVITDTRDEDMLWVKLQRKDGAFLKNIQKNILCVPRKYCFKVD